MKNFESKKIVLKESIKLDSGKLLQKCELAYMTYGRLNKNKSNAILVCHALTGDQYCSGKSYNKKRWVVEYFNRPWKSYRYKFFMLFVQMF